MENLYNNDVIILLHFMDGLGDCYSSLLTSYYSKLRLEELGLKVGLGILSSNLYINKDEKMWYMIFDFSKLGFVPPIVNQNEYSNIKSNLIEFKKERNIIEIFYNKSVGDKISSYKHLNYDIHETKNLSSLSNVPNLIHSSITNKSKSKYSEYNNDICVHIRVGDNDLTSSFQKIKSNNFYNDRFEELTQRISSEPNTKFFIFSDNIYVRNYFVENYDNCESDISEINTKVHNTRSNEYDEGFKVVVNNLIEMCGMMYFKEIIRICTWKSNFTLYGEINKP